MAASVWRRWSLSREYRGLVGWPCDSWRSNPHVTPNRLGRGGRGPNREGTPYLGIRLTAITALFADDLLAESLVLKGGNALHLVHGIGSRTSLDVDVSAAAALDAEAVASRLERSLERRFYQKGYRVFDFRFERRPSIPSNPKQAGYEALFKLVSRQTVDRAGSDVARLRREAEPLAPDQSRVFRIQISEYEYCDGATEVDVEAFTIRVYTPLMIAIEKYRALCQQHPDYAARSHKTARARDFLDIHTIVDRTGVHLGGEPSRQLFSAIFAAKDVPLALLRRLGEQREFHRADWPAVQQSTLEPLRPFDEYFDAVVAWVSEL
jgi:hypothetical protein